MNTAANDSSNNTIPTLDIANNEILIGDAVVIACLDRDGAAELDIHIITGLKISASGKQMVEYLNYEGNTHSETAWKVAKIAIPQTLLAQ